MPSEPEEITEIHTRCPFCGGEYVKKGRALTHSIPECAEFKAGPDNFLVIAKIAEAQKIAREVSR